jgi:hypothetical protein
VLNIVYTHYREKQDVPVWSVLRCYKQGTKLVVRQFCTGGCEECSAESPAVKSRLYL